MFYKRKDYYNYIYRFLAVMHAETKWENGIFIWEIGSIYYYAKYTKLV